eukprot:6323649-Pyramimonas_sp.AAC.1
MARAAHSSAPRPCWEGWGDEGPDDQDHVTARSQWHVRVRGRTEADRRGQREELAERPADVKLGGQAHGAQAGQAALAGSAKDRGPEAEYVQGGRSHARCEQHRWRLPRSRQ